MKVFAPKALAIPAWGIAPGIYRPQHHGLKALPIFSLYAFTWRPALRAMVEADNDEARELRHVDGKGLQPILLREPQTWGECPRLVWLAPLARDCAVGALENCDDAPLLAVARISPGYIRTCALDKPLDLSRPSEDT